MPSIRSSDAETVADCVACLYECEDLEQFPHVALSQVRRLVGADSIIFNYVAPSVPLVVAVADPDIPDLAEQNRRLQAVLPAHPVLQHYQATGDPSAYKISDFQSAKEFHASPLYKQSFRELQYEDQLTFALFPPGAELIAVSLARDRRSFSERDRALVNMLRPRMAKAYRHVQRVALLIRALGSGGDRAADLPVVSILLDDRDRPVHVRSDAQAWLDRFFPGNRGPGAWLPKQVADWLRQTRTSAGAQPHPPSLAVERNGQRLRICAFNGCSGTGRILVLGLETTRRHAQSTLRPATLTPREVDVLLLAERGMSNSEIAAALFVSPHTVKKHLENIYAKLHVPNRTAAVAALRALHS